MHWLGTRPPGKALPAPTRAHAWPATAFLDESQLQLSDVCGCTRKCAHGRVVVLGEWTWSCRLGIGGPPDRKQTQHSKVAESEAPPDQEALVNLLLKFPVHGKKIIAIANETLQTISGHIKVAEGFFQFASSTTETLRALIDKRDLAKYLACLQVLASGLEKVLAEDRKESLQESCAHEFEKAIEQAKAIGQAVVIGGIEIWADVFAGLTASPPVAAGDLMGSLTEFFIGASSSIQMMSGMEGMEWAGSLIAACAFCSSWMRSWEGSGVRTKLFSIERLAIST